MRLSDAEAKVKDCAARIDSARLMSKLREFERYGLPGSSFSDGRGGEPPLPLIGTTDRQIDLARDEYQRLIVEAALRLEKARRIETIWCEPIGSETEREKVAATNKGAGQCGNVFCDHVCRGLGNDRLRKANRQPGEDPAKKTVGRCQPCDTYWRRHGIERPRAEVLA